MNNLINEREAAQLLHVSVALLRKQRYLGTGCPYVKLDRLIRYRIADIELYISEHVTNVMAVSDSVFEPDHSGRAQ